jgi:DNA-directed RNA polymerase subunit omega
MVSGWCEHENAPASPAKLETDYAASREDTEPEDHTFRNGCVQELNMNAELIKQALEKVGNPNILVNLISRRVRQLNSGGGALSRPLLADTGHLGVADIALLEIIEGKMGWEVPELEVLTRPVGKKRKKH